MPDKEPTPTPCGGGIVVKYIDLVRKTFAGRLVPSENYHKRRLMSDTRSNNINLRVSLPEKKAIEKRARDREVSASAFIRSKLFSDQGHQQRVNALKVKEPRLYALWLGV